MEPRFSTKRQQSFGYFHLAFRLFFSHFVAYFKTYSPLCGPLLGRTLCAQTYCDLLVEKLPCQSDKPHAVTVFRHLRVSTTSRNIVHRSMESLSIASVRILEIFGKQPGECYTFVENHGTTFHIKIGATIFH